MTVSAEWRLPAPRPAPALPQSALSQVPAAPLSGPEFRGVRCPHSRARPCPRPPRPRPRPERTQATTELHPRVSAVRLPRLWAGPAVASRLGRRGRLAGHCWARRRGLSDDAEFPSRPSRRLFSALPPPACPRTLSPSVSFLVACEGTDR